LGEQGNDNMSLDIKTTRIERVVIECPVDEAKTAINWMYDNGYHIARGGYSGPAMAKNGDHTFDQTRYHTEGEKEIEETTLRSNTEVLVQNYWGVKIKGWDGVVREVSYDQIQLTGVAPTVADLKSGRVNRSELGTIGFFRHPDGYLCDSSLYDKYVKEET